MKKIIQCAIMLYNRRDARLTLQFRTGSWMVLIDSRNSNKMAAIYTVHTLGQLDLNFKLFIFP